MEEHMECSVQGIISEEAVGPLRERLRGWQDAPEQPVNVHERCLRSCVFGKVASSELRLLQDVANSGQPSHPEWLVVQPGEPLRNPSADKLRALVRGVTVSGCSGDALTFFRSVGFTTQFQFLRKGMIYILLEQGLPLIVSVVQICKVDSDEKVQEEAVSLAPNTWLVEVTSRATSETYAAVSASIGSFCDRPMISSLLEFSKASIPPCRPKPVVQSPK
mmetsp:Transcript_33661/g.46610  ORF Transcript_33661/g.46610 Transcript_33661/m.46610 type:complete len:219 (+) Transcript_33661:192-848(+)